MVKHIGIACVALVFCTGVHAQDSGPFASRGLLNASSSIAPAFQFDRPLTNIYVFGGAEYFFSDRISFRGDGYWYIDSQQQQPLLKENSQLTFGPFYHYCKHRLDLSAGFEPGISLTQLAAPDADVPAPSMKVLPNISVSGGITYYVWKYMHFFATARYVHAQYPGVAGAMPLDEVMVFGGLGWQVRLVKK